ncbi:MAG TPA: hypothetical protein VGN86_05800 [Pyrinomonadaceae bacterium]|nr:hypothetical protein [Pyrinomonadaceae bacterium]
MPTLLEEFTEFVAALNRRTLAYAVCGGWAMTIHGYPRATMDVDVMVLPEDLPQAWQIAVDLGYSVEGLALNFHDGAIEIKRISKIDAETKILFTIDFLLVTEATQQIWRDRETVEWEHGAISTVSRAGLIQLKKISGRLQDLADIERLENES